MPDDLTAPTRWPYVAIIAAVCVAFWTVAALYTAPHDDTDPPEGRSRLLLLTDHATGCQYLGNGYHGITPRLDGAGTHIGCRR